ncbi:MAG: hypothetical protein KDD94_07960 [Calditrichaeota bacterium]|nr:hypothetical protein [Calditrichota bacterium]
MLALSSLMLVLQILLTNNDELLFTFNLKYSSKNHHEFYSDVDVAIGNNTIFVLDIGNKRVLGLDSNYNTILSFGKEGNGPGELNMITNLILTEHRLIVNGFSKQIFDFKGEYLGQINYLSSVGLIEENGKLVLLLESDISGHFNPLYFDLEGKDIGNQLAAHQGGYVSSRKKNSESELKIRHVEKLNNSYIIQYFGRYMFGITTNGTTTLYNRIYERKKYETYDDLVFAIDNGQILTKELYGEALEMYKKKFGEYRDDISGIIGTISNCILILTSSNNQKFLKFDMINLTTRTYREFKYKFEDKVKRVKLFKDQMIVSFLSDETGPYFNIYKIEI